MGKIWRIFCCTYFLIHWINGQIDLFGCPEGWSHSSGKCYKFESNQPKVYEEAAADCWMQGATLLTVNNAQEHSFISGHLTNLHASRPSVWLTSGIYGNGILTWEGDNSINGDVTYWIRQPQVTDIFSRVAYQYGGHLFGGYGWTLVSGSIRYNYICEIAQTQASVIETYSRDFEYGMAPVDKNIIISGPTLIHEPVGVVVVGSGSNAIFLECGARANPTPSYKWYRGTYGNETITPGTNSRYTLSGGRLTIQQPDDEQDANYYRCSVENDQGLILSKMAQLMFGYLHQFSPVRPDDAWGTQSEGVKIACGAPSYSPAVKYSWYKFRSNNWVYPGHPYHFNSQAGYLYFSEVQFTDDRQYFCIVTLTARQGMVKSTQQPVARTSYGRYLVIKPGKNAGGYGPIIHTHTFPSPALKGNDIRMECIAYGSEDGRPLPKGSQIINRNRVLIIPDAQLDAEGNYVCKCKRPGAVATKVISLQMEAIPYFPNQISDMLADAGQKVTWRCRSVARPTAIYTWYKNGQIINFTPGQIEQQDSNLVIFSVDASRDEGMYQCAATNQHGTTFSTGQLKVLSFKPNFNRYPLASQTLGPLGGNITLPCQAEGAPLPTVIWEKNGSPLQLQPGYTDNHMGMTLKNSLVLTGLQYSDAGRYTCKATNTNGLARNSTMLNLIKGIIITRAPAPTTVKVNQTTFLYCQASYNSLEQDLVYTWKFNGHPLSLKHIKYHFVQDINRGVHGLYVREAQFTDTGLYTCEARSPLHVDSKSAFLTVAGPPGVPAGVYIDHLSITPYSARIIWTVGMETNRGVPMVGYDIEVESHFHPGIWNILVTDIPELVTITDAQEFGLRSDQRMYTANNLVPNNGYRFRIRAINDLGRGTLASLPSTVVKIPATIPIHVPEDISGGGGSVGTLTITWKPLDIADHCAPGIGYYAYYKLHGDYKSQWIKAKIKGNEGEYVATVGLENYFIQYDVMVGAYNDIGDGPNSTVYTVYSAEGLPVAVPTITGLSSTNESSMEVTWDPVADNRENMKGRIAGYTACSLLLECDWTDTNNFTGRYPSDRWISTCKAVQYYWNVNGLRPVDGYQPVKFRWRNTHGNATSVILIDLEINSEWFFRMQVFNSAGRGPKGEWRRSETPGFAPLKYPMFVKVYSHSEQSVIVHWRGISVTLNEESLMGYVIKYWKVSEDIRSATRIETGRVMEATVDGLQKKTVYVLRVAGLSGGGDGQMSDPVYFTILGGVISLDPATSDICYGDQACGQAFNNLPMYHYILLINMFTCMYISLL